MRNVKKIKVIFSFILVLTIFTSSLSNFAVSAAFAPDEKLYSEAIYMVNLDTDSVVYKQNENKRIFPASTTKIMTALVALENISDLDAIVEVPYDAFNEFSSGDINKEGVSSAAIEPQQGNVTYRDCLYGLILPSGCEAANILAYNVGGSIENFVKMMNDKAKALGCKDTLFANTHGLYENNHYSTAADLYLISKAAYDTPNFMEISDTYQYDMPPNKANPDGYTITHTSKLIKNSSENQYYYQYAHGIKTGSIDYYYDPETKEKLGEGGRSLVSSAKKNGFSYLLVTLNAPYFDSDKKGSNYSFTDHINLYNWAFDTFVFTNVIAKTDPVTKVTVEQGEKADFVTLMPATDYSALLPKDLDKKTAIQQIINAEKTVTAPVEKGQILGTVELKLSGETIATINLIAAEGVERSQLAYFADKFKEIVDTWWFKVGAVVLVLLIIGVVVLSGIRKSKRNKEKQKSSRRYR